MKRLLFVLIFICFCSCDSIFKDSFDYSFLDNYEQLDKGVRLVVIDSCEYLVFSTPYCSSIVHKGNCKFCLERNNSLLYHETE